MKLALVPLVLCAVAGTASALTVVSAQRNPTALEPSQTSVDPQAQFQSICLRQAGAKVVASSKDTFGARCQVAGGSSFSFEDLDRAIKAKSGAH